MELSSVVLSDITTFMKYAKYIPELGRRETWEELVTRNMNMHIKKYPHMTDEIREAYKLVYDKKVLPSMRSLQFGGKPIEISPNRLFNCCFLPMDDWRAFSEIMFLLLGGVGVGFSVQYHHIEKLPEIRKPNPSRKRRFLIGDSIEGWADSIKVLMKSYFNGMSTPVFDYSDIRPKGALLVTSGGKAPGPQPLKDCIHHITKILDSKEDGDKLSSLEVHDIVCYIADAVLAGGIRRAALISLFSFDDEVMATCKYGNWWELNPQRGRSNNSAVILRHRVEKDEFMSFWERVKKSGSGEPGVYFSHDKDLGINPCFSPETKIAVADGRGAVSIKELSDAGDDIPVYTVDKKTGKVRIEMGRSPRCTRKNAELVRVTLDDGSYLDVTPDHGMMLRDGSYVKAMDLTPGDSLCRFTKRAEKMRKDGTSKYWRVNCDTKTGSIDRIFEHRLVSKFFNKEEWDRVYDKEQKNGWINGGLVIHHKDYNSLNNNPDNLEIMSFRDHAKFHSDRDTQGVNNSNYSGFTNTEIEEYAKKITKEAGRRISYKEWITGDHPYIKSLSKWRQMNWFSSISDLLKWAAVEVGVEHIDTDPRVVKTLFRAKSLGYNAYINNGEVLVNKVCDGCKNEFISTWKGRHTVYCSIGCVPMRDSFVDDCNYGIINKQKHTLETQIKVYSDLKYSLDRAPLKKEWVLKCRELGVPYRTRPNVNNKNKYLIKSYSHLKSVAADYNHKVVSVTFLDYKSDVYNITVDETHTVGIVTSESENVLSGIFTYQCAEIALRPNQMCNLTEINASDVVDQSDLNERARVAAFIGTLQAGYTDFHYLRDIWRRTTEKEALIGVGMTGIASGAVLGLDLVEAAKCVLSENERVAKLIGINKAARTTTVKPSGTSSTVLSCSSGIHAWHGKYYIRNIRVGKNESIYTYLANNHPELVEDEYFRPEEQAVIGIPQKAPEGSILRDESTLDFLNRVSRWNEEWVRTGHRSGANTHNVSATVSIREDEWEMVAEWMWKSRGKFNGLSCLPYNDSDHTYVQAPFQDCTEAEYEARVQSLKQVELTNIIEVDDNTNLSGEIACGADGCVITEL